ncbi:MAG: Ni/Fe hydrogenase subunit alpha [Bacillota bacterium]|jgi:coenzyme F420-reducing hydrogenase alpha subunit|nr:Ni/Fe hydrogenase subunit alpha [Bacillota bacterium]
MHQSRVKVDYLTRVEGEGGIEILLDEERKVREIKVHIFEPPRFFEGILKGRRCEEVPDIVARICGICPVSYQMAALKALERILGIKPGRQVRLLRKVFALSQWIQSHSLHVFCLALPDFLGYDDIFQMAGKHRDLVERGLRLKKLGNDITSMLGGREVHPVSAVLGGFTKLPPRSLREDLITQLEARQEDAHAALEFIAGLALPAWEGERVFGALSHPEEYAIDEGRWRTSTGLSLAPEEFPDYVEEFQVSYSNALRCRLKDGPYYMVGPLARVRLNFEQLAPEAQRAALRLNLNFFHHNPYHSIVARLLEIVHAIEACCEYLEEAPEKEETISYEVKGGEAASIVEAPRGSLFHWYQLNERGFVQKARIIAPTTQNLHRIEQDLRELVPAIAGEPDGEIARSCAVAVRNYDPCISCATHFLTKIFHSVFSRPH